MRPISFSRRWLATLILAGVLPAAAQLSNSQSDPLARIREAAKTNVQACSATGETLCEQITPKIIALEQDDSPLTENLRGMFLQLSVAKLQSPEEMVAWGVAAFRAAGVTVHTEINAPPQTVPALNLLTQDAIVAEIRGREKPDEWILLGTRIDGHDPDTIRTASNAALLVEAARDIQLTGIRPRRSIRFVILIGGYPPINEHINDSWTYVHAHREELDHIRAAICFSGGASRVTGYFLNGRHDVETGLREAMKPIEALDAGHHTMFVGSTEIFDFLLEGVPTIFAHQKIEENPSNILNLSEALAAAKIQELKRNTEVAAVTAFGIAELPGALGPRQTRAEIENLLETMAEVEEMKRAGVWPLWESGQRGRRP